MKRKLIIGTRSSKLAIWQSMRVKSMIEALFDDVEIEIKHIKTKGDKIIDSPLSKIGGKGLFTKEIENKLIDGAADLAVHSLKDLPVDLPVGLRLCAITNRIDPSDAIVSKYKINSLKDLRRRAKVATGSMRRRAQIKIARPDVEIVDVRGNVDTRLKKYLSSDWDAIILAKSGLERLGLGMFATLALSSAEMLPAVGQGALAVETAAANELAGEVCAALNDEKAQLETTAERAFLKGLGGGCQNPIAGLAVIEDDELTLEGLVATIDGKTYFRDKISGAKENAAELGEKLAQMLLNRGAGEIVEPEPIDSDE